MDFVSIRIITDQIKPLVAFYETITGLTATWFTPDFAELATPPARWRSAARAPWRCSGLMWRSQPPTVR